MGQHPLLMHFAHEKVKNALQIPEIKCKISDAHNVHANATVKFRVLHTPYHSVTVREIS